MICHYTHVYIDNIIIITIIIKYIYMCLMVGTRCYNTSQLIFTGHHLAVGMNAMGHMVQYVSSLLIICLELRELENGKRANEVC